MGRVEKIARNGSERGDEAEFQAFRADNRAKSLEIFVDVAA